MNLFKFLSFLCFFSSIFSVDVGFVPNYNDNNVTPVYVPTLTTLPNISVGTSPSFVFFTRDNKYALALNLASDNVSVINLSTLSVIKTFAVGPRPQIGAVTYDNKYALICCGTAITPYSVVTIVDLSTFITVANITLSNYPGDIALTLDGRYALITIPLSNKVVPIDLTTFSALADINVGAGPFGIAVTRDNQYALVANRGTNTVTPILISTLTPLTNITVESGPAIIKVTDNYAYVGCDNGGAGPCFIVPIDLSSLTSLTSISIPGANFSLHDTKITFDDKYLLANVGTDFNILELSNNNLTSFSLPQFGVAVDVTSDNHYALLLLNGLPGNVTPFDLTTFNFLSPITVGDSPIMIGITNVSFPPTNITGTQKQINSLFQKDLVNVITWEKPSLSNPVSYKIFRDSTLLNLAGEVSGAVTTFYDHRRSICATDTYYVVSVDANGNMSDPISMQLP